MNGISGIILNINKGIKSNFVLNEVSAFMFFVEDRLNTQPVQLIIHDGGCQ